MRANRLIWLKLGPDRLRLAEIHGRIGGWEIIFRQ
jgi:hypothetical protein